MEFANLGLLLLFHVNDYYLLFLLCATLSATVLAQMAKIRSRKVIGICEHAAFKINDRGEKMHCFRSQAADQTIIMHVNTSRKAGCSFVFNTVLTPIDVTFC